MMSLNCSHGTHKTLSQPHKIAFEGHQYFKTCRQNHEAVIYMNILYQCIPRVRNIFPRHFWRIVTSSALPTQITHSQHGGLEVGKGVSKFWISLPRHGYARINDNLASYLSVINNTALLADYYYYYYAYISSIATKFSIRASTLVAKRMIHATVKVKEGGMLLHSEQVSTNVSLSMLRRRGNPSNGLSHDIIKA